VFRRRSLLFLGSGILEDYLLNLFSEIIYNHGPSAHPHIALLPTAERDRFDIRFLETRLGIKPLFWDTKEEIGTLLTALKNAVTPIHTRPSHNIAQPSARSYSLTEHAFEVTLAFRPLPFDAPDGTALVISAGRYGNLPFFGEFGYEFLDRTGREDWPENWHALDANTDAYIYQYQQDPLFALAARGPADGYEHRDLSVIPDAVSEALHQIEQQGFTRVVMVAIATGHASQNLWDPIHPFAQMLRGIRRFTQSTTRNTLLGVEICLVDARIWALLSSDTLPIQEMLSAEYFPCAVEFHRHDGHVERFNLLIQDGSLVGDVLEKCGLNPSDWNVELHPHPTESTDRPVQVDQIITPTMTLTVVPKSRASD